MTLFVEQIFLQMGLLLGTGGYDYVLNLHLVLALLWVEMASLWQEIHF